MKINSYYESDEYLFKNKESSDENKTILIVIENYDLYPSPCEYIRVCNVFNGDKIKSKYKIRYSSFKDAKRFYANVVVFSRIPTIIIEELFDYLKYLNSIDVKIIYEIDDDLISLPTDHPEYAHYSSKSVIIELMLKHADLVITSTSYLSNKYRTLCKKIITLGNRPGFEVNELRAQIINGNEKIFYNIVYMGTRTHINDLKIVLPAIKRMEESGIKVRLFLIGMSGNMFEYPFIRNLQVPKKIKRYPQFIQWLRSFKNIHLGIAPLLDSEFNRCKSAVKYFDYCSMGVPTIASSVGEYVDFIEDGINGYLVKEESDWYEKLNKAFNDYCENKNQIIIKNALNNISNFNKCNALEVTLVNELAIL